MQQCIYVSASWGIHDIRWFNALGEIGFDAIPCRLGYEASDIQGARAILHKISNAEMPILAGPLNTVTQHLLGVPGHLVGLSWGFDMYASDDFTWLSGLDGLIVDSRATREIAETSGLPSDRITLMPWGVDLARFSPNGAKQNPKDLGFLDDSQIVLSLRAHEPLYRVSDTLHAFARIATRYSDVYLVVGHQGSLTEALRHEAYQLRILDRVRFIGTVKEEELPLLMRRSHVYVSASEVDGTSVTLLQAMASGLPVVVSDTPGNLGWVEHGITGLTFRTGDSTDLADQLSHVLTSNDPRRTQLARARVEEDANWQRNLARLKHTLLGA